MNPIVILIPAAALIMGPRALASHMLKKHDKEDQKLPLTASELARKILDDANLQIVKVECTDTVDHYDHIARAVRLSRDRFDRKSLSAITTAAHEAAHALQHASGYKPFIWRAQLSRVAQIAGQVGSVMLVAMPAISLAAQKNPPLRTMGGTLFFMLGTGLIAQLAALPSEFDASFNRALPILRAEYIDSSQSKGARGILIACSTTYIASPLITLLNFWPWFVTSSRRSALKSPLQEQHNQRPVRVSASGNDRAISARSLARVRSRSVFSGVEPLVRRLLRPKVSKLQTL